MIQNPIAAVTAPDPYSYYRELVVTRPVYYDDRLGLWVVASAATVDAMLATPAARVRPPAEPVPKALVGGTAGEVFGRFARMTDGPAQVAMKQAIRAALAGVTAERVALLARDWLARRFEDGELLHDAVLNEIASTLPVSVLAAVIGVPSARHGALCGWVADFVAGIAPSAAAEGIARANDAARQMLDLLHPLCSGAEGDTLPTLRAAVADAPAAAVAANALGFLFQTYEATAGLFGNALLAAGRHRAVYERAATEGRLGTFVAEVQRCDPPVHNTRRFLAADAVVAGRAMRAGEAALVVLAAANHDEAANPTPARFDIDRADRRSFTFGAGCHACPGEIIATAIAAAAVEMLAPRIAGLDRLAERVSYRPLPNARVPVFGGKNTEGETQ